VALAAPGGGGQHERHGVARIRRAAGVALALAACGPAWARGPAAPALTREHSHASGAFTFKVPEAWTVKPLASPPGALEAGGGGSLVRLLYWPGDAGYDSLHVDCMLVRLAPPMEMSPGVKYEYDFLSGGTAGRRFLDSAFVVRYDAAVLGHREWRQRNLTVVGGGHSLCAITYVPLSLWKKDRGLRALLDAVLASVTFAPAPTPALSPPVSPVPGR